MAQSEDIFSWLGGYISSQADFCRFGTGEDIWGSFAAGGLFLLRCRYRRHKSQKGDFALPDED